MQKHTETTTDWIFCTTAKYTQNIIMVELNEKVAELETLAAFDMLSGGPPDFQLHLDLNLARNEQDPKTSGRVFLDAPRQSGKSTFLLKTHLLNQCPSVLITYKYIHVIAAKQRASEMMGNSPHDWKNIITVDQFIQPGTVNKLNEQRIRLVLFDDIDLNHSSSYDDIEETVSRMRERTLLFGLGTASVLRSHRSNTFRAKKRR